MKNILPIVALVILTSFYFFPFEFSFLPGVNTKMAMAGIGLVVVGFNLGRLRESVLKSDIVWASLLAAVVSFIGYISTTYNGTSDYSYATYLVSMWVWLSGAYVVVSCMKWYHGRIDIQLVCNYLIVVCVTQCLIALLMDFFPWLKHFVDSFLGGEGFMGKNENRLYGVGAALDVAGSRFAAVLIMIAFMCSRATSYIKSQGQLLLYLLAFAIILVVGNMMARTTIMGAVFAMIIVVYQSFFNKSVVKETTVKVWPYVMAVVLSSALIFGYLYQTNDLVHDHLRFAFEGFFSLVEEGHWQVRSNNQLLYHWDAIPQGFKTWLIGDGYFSGHASDPYYIGPTWGEYYHSTDVGYWRLIYYFGLMGLFAFSAFMCYAAYVCMKRNSSCKLLFLLLLLLNFSIWAKVSTDIFLVFALFLLLENEADTSECGAELTE